MNRAALKTLASVGLILLIATPCYAHSLHPVFWWLGPFAPVMAIVSILGCLPLAAIIAAQAILLYRFIPGMPYLGNLWRAAVIFALSKVAETLPAFINSDVFFGPSSDAEIAVIAVLMIVAAVVATALLIKRLYGRMRPRTLKIVGLSLVLECVSLGGLFLTTTTLFYMEIIQ